MTVTGATGTAIGTGSQNTSTIVTVCAEPGIAARICDDLDLNGYTDWYLPSKDELYKLYVNKNTIGGFASAVYWSSTEYAPGYSALIDFTNGFQSDDKKTSGYYVRAIRSF
jgi:hypothetical protein